MTTAIFLADCGPSVGLGHLRRLLVLAAEFRREQVFGRFLLTDMRYADFVKRAGMQASPWRDGEMPLPSADLVAIDGYGFDADLPSRWTSQTACTVMVVDDLADKPTDADVVLNHNLYGGELDYRHYRARVLLTGPQYALVDPAFASLATRARPDEARMLISFGGTDNGRYGEAAARAVLERNSSVIVDLILPPTAETPGPARLAGEYSGRCHVHVGAAMVDRLSAARVYLGAAGVTLLEAIAAGVDVVVCGLVDNQRYNIRKLQNLSVPAFDRFAPDEMAVAALKALSAPTRSKLPEIDGRGAARVAQAVLGLRRRDANGSVAARVV